MAPMFASLSITKWLEWEMVRMGDGWNRKLIWDWVLGLEICLELIRVSTQSIDKGVRSQRRN